MPIAISITVTGLTEARNIMNKLSKRLPDVSQRELRSFAFSVARNMKSNAAVFSFPRPYLETRIRAVKRGKGRYDIKAPRYSWFVEFGTRPHAMPIGPLQERWAAMAGMSPWKLFLGVYDRGTMPRPFIRPALAQAVGEMYDTSEKIVKDTLA
jgi:hypothetical protein